MKNQTDEQFDMTISKVNEIDGRLAQLEEKDQKSIMTEEEINFNNTIKNQSNNDKIAEIEEQL